MTCPLCWIFSICPSDPLTTLFCAPGGLICINCIDEQPFPQASHCIWSMESSGWRLELRGCVRKGYLFHQLLSLRVLSITMSQLLPANLLYIACPVSRPCWLLSLFLQPNVGTPLGNYRVPGSLPTLFSYFCKCTLYESNYFHTFELLTLSVSSLSC